jgi:hypothetical protein
MLLMDRILPFPSIVSLASLAKTSSWFIKPIRRVESIVPAEERILNRWLADSLFKLIPSDL